VYANKEKGHYDYEKLTVGARFIKKFVKDK
jgi:hypothetical protein